MLTFANDIRPRSNVLFSSSLQCHDQRHLSIINLLNCPAACSTLLALIILLFAVVGNQCDQMDILFGHVHCTTRLPQKRYNFAKVGSKICQTLNKPLAICRQTNTSFSSSDDAIV